MPGRQLRQVLQPRKLSQQQREQRNARLLRRERGWNDRWQSNCTLPTVASTAIDKANARKLSSATAHQLGGGSSDHELAVVKAIVHREGVLARVHAAVLEFRSTATENKRKMNADARCILELLAMMREATVDVVQAIDAWRNAQPCGNDSSPPTHVPIPYVWKNCNYLIRVVQDLNFLSEIPELVNALRISPTKLRQNPLMLPRTLLDARTEQNTVAVTANHHHHHAKHQQQSSEDEVKSGSKARLCFVEHVLAEELNWHGLSDSWQDPQLNAPPSVTDIHRAVNPKSLDLSQTEVRDLLTWLESASGASPGSVSPWSEGSRYSLRHSSTITETSGITPMRRRRRHSSSTLQTDTRARTRTRNRMHVPLVTEEDMAAVARIEEPSPQLVVIAASVMLLVSGVAPTNATDVNWTSFQEKVERGGVAWEMSQLSPTAVPKAVIRALSPLVDSMKEKAITGEVGSVAALSITRVFDWIKHMVDTARGNPSRPVTAQASTATVGDNHKPKSPEVHCSQTPIAIYRKACSGGLPVTLIIFPTKSRYQLRVVADDDNDFVSAQLGLDISDPAWANFAQANTSAKKELLSSLAWWLKNLPLMLAIDRISSKALTLRVDRQQFRQLLMQAYS